MQIVKDVVKDEIDEFKNQTERFLSGTLNEEKFKTIRINQGIYSQRQPGFYMVRTKLSHGRISDYQLDRIADVVRQYSRSFAHLTTRQDIQIYWIDLSSAVKILSAYAEVGITTRGAGGNSVRNTTACPLAGICSKELFDVSSVAHDTTAHFLHNPLCRNLPRKFKISYSGCDDDCIYSRINDVGFIASQKNGEAGFKVYVGGGLGGHPKSAYPIMDFIPFNEAIHFTEAVIRVFDKYGNRTNRNMARLKYIIEEKGIDEVKGLIEQEYEGVKELYGKQQAVTLPADEIGNSPLEPELNKETDVWFGKDVIKQKQEDYYAVVIHIPYGDTTSGQLKEISGLSRRYGSGEIRITLDQNFIIPWVRRDNLNNLHGELERLKLIPSDNCTLNIISCPGARICNIGIARSQGLAQAIHNELDSNFKADLSDVAIRVCGCPNSCAHHHIGNIGFSGMARRIGDRYAPFYQLYLGGSAKYDNFRFAKPLLKIPAKHAPAMTRTIVELYNKTKQDGEVFNEWLDRYGEDRLIEGLLIYSYLPEYERGPEFYYDYGTDEPFSIKDIGVGECASGVVDTIEIYLTRAETKVMDADTYAKRGVPEQSMEQARLALTYAIQALLIMQGEDPETISADLTGYIKQLKTGNIINEHIVNVYNALFNSAQHADLLQLVKDIRKAVHRIRKITESFDEALLSGKSIKETSKSEVKMRKELLDLKGVKCPYNYVKAKLKLEELTSGEELELYLDEGEPIENVPRSLEDDGNTIVSIDKLDDTHYSLVVKKA